MKESLLTAEQVLGVRTQVYDQQQERDGSRGRGRGAAGNTGLTGRGVRRGTRRREFRDGGRGRVHDVVEQVGEGVSAGVRAPVLEPVPRTTLTLDEAAASLGVSLSHFRRYVLPDLRIVDSGKARPIPVAELYRWAEKHARLVAQCERR